MPQRKLGSPLATELNMLFTCASSTGSSRKVQTYIQIRLHLLDILLLMF